MTSDIIPSKVERAERIEGSTDMVLPRIGEWYWLHLQRHYRLEEVGGGLVRNLTRPPPTEDHQNPYASGEVLTVVTEVGSNYATLTCVDGSSYQRVHLDELESRAKREPNIDAPVGLGLARPLEDSLLLVAGQPHDARHRAAVEAAAEGAAGQAPVHRPLPAGRLQALLRRPAQPSCLPNVGAVHARRRRFRSGRARDAPIDDAG